MCTSTTDIVQVIIVFDVIVLINIFIKGINNAYDSNNATQGNSNSIVINSVITICSVIPICFGICNIITITILVSWCEIRITVIPNALIIYTNITDIVVIVVVVNSTSTIGINLVSTSINNIRGSNNVKRSISDVFIENDNNTVTSVTNNIVLNICTRRTSKYFEAVTMSRNLALCYQLVNLFELWRHYLNCKIRSTSARF